MFTGTEEKRRACREPRTSSKLTRYILKPHSEFHNLVFYIIYFEAAKFSKNLKLYISDKFLPWGSLDIISIFFRLTIKL